MQSFWKTLVYFGSLRQTFPCTRVANENRALPSALFNENYPTRGKLQFHCYTSTEIKHFFFFYKQIDNKKQRKSFQCLPHKVEGM